VTCWPDFVFPPINLFNFPKQHRDYMNHQAERRKANRMKLKPVKKPRDTSQIIITPTRGIGHSVEIERILRCREWRVKA